MTPLVSVMRVDYLVDWLSSVPESFDGLVLLPNRRVARVLQAGPGRRVRWILPSWDRNVTHLLQSSPQPDAAAIAGEASTNHTDGSPGNTVSPAHLQEPSPEPNHPPAAAPNLRSAEAVLPHAARRGGSPVPALATGGAPCQPIPSSR